MRPEKEMSGAELRSEVNAEFRIGDFEKWDEEKLKRMLSILVNERTNQEQNWSRDIIRAACINHLQHLREVRDLDARNTKLQKHIRWLTFAGVVLALVAASFAYLSWELQRRSLSLQQRSLDLQQQSSEVQQRTTPLPSMAPKTIEGPDSGD